MHRPPAEAGAIMNGIPRTATGVLVLLIMAFGPLSRMDYGQKTSECAIRRELLVRGGYVAPATRICPLGETPYVYELTADSQIVIISPHGVGQELVERGTWFRLSGRTYSP
jgi:hypothetical protein